MPQIVARILADNLQPPLKPVRGNKFAEGSIFPISSGERCGVEESVDLCPAVNSYDFGRTHRYSHPFCLSFLLSERKFPAIDVCPSFFCSLSLSLPPFLLLEGSCTRKRACNRRWINSICLVNRLAYRGKRCSRFNLYGSYEGVNYPRHRGARLPPIDAIPPTFFPITIFPH